MASKLVSMKLSKAATKKMMEPSLAEGDRPRYPWGLSISLDKDALEKLDIDELPKVGESYLLVAMVDVVGVDSNENEGGSNKNVRLQITEMCLEEPDSKASKGATKALYGDED